MIAPLIFADAAEAQAWDLYAACAVMRIGSAVHATHAVDIADAMLVERLQDISEDDAKAEGVTIDPSAFYGGPALVAPHRFEFYRLWNSINAERAPWDSNPWVWALTFRRLP